MNYGLHSTGNTVISYYQDPLKERRETGQGTEKGKDLADSLRGTKKNYTLTRKRMLRKEENSPSDEKEHG